MGTALFVVESCTKRQAVQQLVVLSVGGDGANEPWSSPPQLQLRDQPCPRQEGRAAGGLSRAEGGERSRAGAILGAIAPFPSPFCPTASRSLLAAFQPGGEMYFSDVYASQRLSEAVRKHRVLWGA